MGLLKKIALLIVVLPLLSSCIREEEVTNTPQGNFEALWKIIDEQYCFLEVPSSYSFLVYHLTALSLSFLVLQ